jgi:hypothetical protein
MNPFKFGQLMKHLVRAKQKKPDLPEVFRASEAQIPEKTLTRDMFREAQERFKNAKAGGGMLVQPGFGGTRQGYAKDKRGFGSEKGARFKSPSKNQLTQAELITLLEKELGPEYKFKRGSLSGDPKSSVKGGQRVNYLQNMLKDLLDRKAIATRGEQVRFLFNKPNAQQLDFIKTFIDSPFLSQQTVRNMEILDKKFGKKLSKASGKKFFMKELTIDMARKTLEDAGVKDVTTSKLARAMTRLAQQYQGRLFRNQPNIKINKKAGNFIFKSFNELDQYHPWRQGSYEAVLDDIDAALGKKVGKISAFKTRFKEKMQVRYPDRKFNFNEVFSISTSANRGSYPYAYFVDLTEDAMNKGALSSLQGKASIAEGKIQNNITKYRRTGNIKFYNEAVRVADVYNNTTRQNFLDSKKVLDYERKYGIKPNAYKIEIGSQRQVSDKLNFAKNFYKNSDLNKWKNMGIDIDAHSGQKGYVKAFDTKTLPKNIVTAPELFTKESVLRETKIIDDKKLNEFFNKNKKLIAALGGGKCGRGLKNQGGRIGLQDGTPNVDACYKNALERIRKGGVDFTRAEAINFDKLTKGLRAVGASNIIKFGVLPEVLLEGALVADKMASEGDTFAQALRNSYLAVPFQAMGVAKTYEEGEKDRILAAAPESQKGRILDAFSMQDKLNKKLELIGASEGFKKQIAATDAVSDGPFGYVGDTQDLQKRLSDARENLQDLSRGDLNRAERLTTSSPLDLNIQDQLTRDAFRSAVEKADADKASRILVSPGTGFGVDAQIRKRMKDIPINIDTAKEDLKQTGDMFGIGYTPLGLNQLFPALGLQSREFGVDPVTGKYDQDRGLQDYTNYLRTLRFADTFRDEKAGGGIAKLAGVDSGPPPSSGPNSQGLQGLMKRVRNR